MSPVGSPDVIAVCGKGGAGKTVVSALLAKVVVGEGRKRPILLIDADPAGGLAAAIGERTCRSLADVRTDLIRAARNSDRSDAPRLAEQVDYLLLEALVERSAYSFLAMGRSLEKGCYCPINTLLREAIDILAGSFACVLIDAEAGLEQINREVTRRLTRALAVVDGSMRSADTARLIAEMVGRTCVATVVNRVACNGTGSVPDGMPPVIGCVPEDPLVARYDREGRPLWELPEDALALEAVRGIAFSLGLV